jgi:DNA-binding beta-propeller fold protein YncE
VDGQEVFAITTSTAALTSVLSVTALLDGQITGTTSLTVASPNQPLGGALGDGTLVLSSTAGPTAFTYAQTPQQILSVGQNPFAIVGYTETMVFVSTAAGITPIIAGDTGWSVQQAIPMPMNSWLPWGLAMNPEATLVAIACQSGNNGLVVFFDPSSKQMLGNVVIEGTARQNAGTLELAFTLDGNYVFATNEYINTVSVIQVNGGTSPALAATVAVGLTPTGIAMDANYAYVICQDAAAQLQVIDIATAITNPSVSIVATVSAGTDPVRIVLGSTGGEDYAWVSDRGGNAVLTFNTADLISSPGSGPLATTPVGIAPVGLLLFGGGDYIAVSNSNRFSNPLSDGTMTVLDTTTVLSQSGSSVVATVNAHLFPREFGAVPDGSTFFLTNFSSGEVMVFDADQFIS